MSDGKTIEISAVSEKNFEDAIKNGIEAVAGSANNIRGAWVSEQKVQVENGRVIGYRVDLRVTLIPQPSTVAKLPRQRLEVAD
ncbi:MAG: dodecin domain-containing protein [Halomonadaceae bacterium]|nr:MAG: dodecin domain-containing protein [Halomonadaceae bacterium]